VEAAGGAQVNTALVCIAPQVAIDNLMASKPQERAERFKAALATDDGLWEAAAIASLDGHLPAAEDVEAEQKAYFAAHFAHRRRGHTNEPEGKCETQRVGRATSWASIMRNPDVVGYARMYNVPGGRSHTDHLMFVTEPGGSGVRLLMLYVCGPFGNPSPGINAKAKDGAGTDAAKDLKKRLVKAREATNAERLRCGLPELSTDIGDDQPVAVQEKLSTLRLSYGQPRSMEIVAGRIFLDASQKDNMNLQRSGGAHAKWHRAVATCGVVGISLLASIHLAPRPTDDADAWFTRRQQRHTQLLGQSVAKTGECYMDISTHC